MNLITLIDFETKVHKLLKSLSVWRNSSSFFNIKFINLNKFTDFGKNYEKVHRFQKKFTDFEKSSSILKKVHKFDKKKSSILKKVHRIWKKFIEFEKKSSNLKNNSSRFRKKFIEFEKIVHRF